MQLGICAAVEQADAIRAAGWAYVEVSVQDLLQGDVSAEDWRGAARVQQAALPVAAANMLVPAALKLVGPNVDFARVERYMRTVIERAGTLGTRTLVFGSGGARNVPEGTDRAAARAQILAFLRTSAPIAAQHGVTIVIEPLNNAECNIINSVAEAMTYVRDVAHPHVQCLFDSYHFWYENEPLANLHDALPWIKHVHLADLDGRLPPGESGTAHYLLIFQLLKAGGYDGLISVEARGFDDIATLGPRVRRFIEQQWAAA